MGKNTVDLSFIIWDFNDITHEQISRMTGIAPYKVFIKGERRNPKFAALAKKNGWIMKPALPEEASFDEQFKAIAELMKSRPAAFKHLCSQYYCELSCGVYIYTDDQEGSTPWIHLGKDYNELVKQFRLELDIDIIRLAEK